MGVRAVSRYAEGTDVSTDRSRAEIERTLERYGVQGLAVGKFPGRAVLEFATDTRRVRVTLPLPSADAPVFTHHSRGQRSSAAAHKAWEQACRQAWRALALVVKAKLEAVTSGISTFEQEFGMAVVMPDGRTVAEHVGPQIDRAYRSGAVAPLELGTGA
jgi:hypothetical protein